MPLFYKSGLLFYKVEMSFCSTKTDFRSITRKSCYGCKKLKSVSLLYPFFKNKSSSAAMPSCFKLVKLCQCLHGAKWWTACSSLRDEIRALASMHIVTRPTSRKPSTGRYRSWDWSGSFTATRGSDRGRARSWQREMRWKVGNSKDKESHDWQRSSWHLCTLMSWPRSHFPARVTRRLPSLSSRSTSSAGGSGRSGRPSSPSLNCWCILETASINQGTDDRKTRGKKHTAFRNALHVLMPKVIFNSGAI